MTLRDFAKYDGDIQKAVQGLLAANYGQVEGIDRTTRKRKWIESQEQEAESAGAKGAAAEEGAKPLKSGRLHQVYGRRFAMLIISFSSDDRCHPEETCSTLDWSRSWTSTHNNEDTVSCMSYQLNCSSSLTCFPR